MKSSFKHRAVRAGGYTRTKSSYRRFIPDARPIAVPAARGEFWYKVWQSMRARA